jgi:hypothetical protein
MPAASASPGFAAPASPSPAAPTSPNPMAASSPEAPGGRGSSPGSPGGRADQPGYGPPGPDWYRRDAGETEGPGSRPAPEPNGGGSVRSPFEPLRRSDQEPGPADSELPDYLSPGYDSHEDAELDLSGLSGDAVGQLHGLYDIAGTIPGGGSDEQFHQLLERQRKLISDYFKESGGPSAPAPAPPSPGETLASERRSFR